VSAYDYTLDPFYGSTTDLMTRLRDSGTGLPLAEAQRLLVVASDQIDWMLKSSVADSGSGRRVLVANVAAYQWDAVARAAVEYAAVVFYYESTDRPAVGGWSSVKGPDFAFSGPLGPVPGNLPAFSGAAMVALRASDLLYSYRMGRATA